MYSYLSKILIVLVLSTTGGLRPAQTQEQTITVFAAASLRNAIDEVNVEFAKASGVRVIVSYAATSALVRQIEQGAPADIFISADLEWMEYAAQKDLIARGSRTDLLGNRLVLIAPKVSPLGMLVIDRSLDLGRLIGDHRIATGDVRAVPAGKYAKAALESLGLWEHVERKLAMVENVRAALMLVARGETPLGIVYATDAQGEPNVKVLGTFPENSHAPIIYPAAATRDAKPTAAQYLTFLRSPAAGRIFERHGFTFLAKPPA